jgi:Family of unknown function (DUF5335)
MNTMTTREIPKEEWTGFFDAFSRRHEGWLVTIEILDRALGAQVEAEARPLRGISADRGGGDADVEIMTGDGADDSLAHIVSHPTRIQIEETEEGGEAAIAIESRGEGTTIVRFRSAARTENVGGAGPQTR